MSSDFNRINQDEIWDTEFWKHYFRHKPSPSKMPTSYNAFPKDCKYSYMTPGYYVKGFRFFNVPKDEIEADLQELKKLLFIEDPKQAHKWGILKKRIPYSEGRITNLPGTRILKYKNYCLRNLTPASTSSWRKSINMNQKFEDEEEKEEEKVNEAYVCSNPEVQG